MLNATLIALGLVATGNAWEEAARRLDWWRRRSRTADGLSFEIGDLEALCRSASGLAALALDRGLVSAGGLPVDVDTFATELVLEPPE
jgi:hypothetical protein